MSLTHVNTGRLLAGTVSAHIDAAPWTRVRWKHCVNASLSSPVGLSHHRMSSMETLCLRRETFRRFPSITVPRWSPRLAWVSFGWNYFHLWSWKQKKQLNQELVLRQFNLQVIGLIVYFRFPRNSGTIIFTTTSVDHMWVCETSLTSDCHWFNAFVLQGMTYVVICLLNRLLLYIHGFFFFFKIMVCSALLALLGHVSPGPGL